MEAGVRIPGLQLVGREECPVGGSNLVVEWKRGDATSPTPNLPQTWQVDARFLSYHTSCSRLKHLVKHLSCYPLQQIGPSKALLL